MNMKNIKKALVAGMAFASMVVIASCNSTSYDVSGAATRVVVEQDKSESVTADFQVARTVKYNDAEYTVSWTSNNDYAKITEIEGNTSKYLVDINYVENQSEAQQVKLVAEIKDPKGKTVSKDFNFKIPQFVVNTIAQADAAEAKTNLTLKGTIVTKEAHNGTTTNVYLQCDGGGFEAYKLTCTLDQYNTDLIVGNSIYVSGPKSYYNGLRELSGCSYNLDEKTATQTITATDLTSKVTDGTGIGTEYQCHLAKLTDLEIVSIGSQDSTGQYSIIVGDKTNKSKQATVRISKYFAAKDSDLWKEYTGLNLVPGQKITVTGFVGWYNGAQITPFETGAIVAGDINYSDSYGLTLLQKVSFPAKVYGVKTINLPTSLYEAGYYGNEGYAGLTAEWSVTSENVTLATKDVAAVEAKAATDTTAAVAATPAYTTTNLTTKKVSADESVVVTLTIKNSAGETVFTGTKTLKLVKDIVIDNHAAYLSAAKGDNVTVQGTIAYLDKESSEAYFTIVDDKGLAYYVYKMPLTDDNKDSIVAGKKVIITGTKDVYNNVIELTKAELLKAEDGTEVAATAITELPTVTPELQAKYVTFTGAIKELSENKRTVTVTVGEKDIVVYLSRNHSDITSAIAVGDNITVKGIFSVNKETSQVITLTADSVTKNAA